MSKSNDFRRSIGKGSSTHITKTHLYNFDPLKPHFYTVKLGFTGVYIIFLISAQKHRLWVPVRTDAEAILTGTTIYVFEQKYEKYQTFYRKTFSFLVVKFSIHLNRYVFVMHAARSDSCMIYICIYQSQIPRSDCANAMVVLDSRCPYILVPRGDLSCCAAHFMHDMRALRGLETLFQWVNSVKIVLFPHWRGICSRRK